MKLGFYEDAGNNYREALRSNPKLDKAYYNLAVLYASENKYDKAKRQLETCLKINRNFPEARDALKKLEGSDQSDWYRWWFGDSEKDKMDKGENNRRVSRRMRKVAFKQVIGAIVMASIAVLIIITIILAFMYAYNLAASVVAGLTFAIAIAVAILLLPSLRKFKAAGIELEPSPFVPGTIKLRPSSLVLEKSIRESSSKIATHLKVTTAEERKK
jgi:tetratricopeptide (TPR) repeat protein